MDYQSTRGGAMALKSSTAIIQGIAPDGGLFIPKGLPVITATDIKEHQNDSYLDWAKLILGAVFSDFNKERLDACIEAAYGTGFDDEAVAPLKKIKDDLYVLELWHGPTAAFKDMALQLLPHLMSMSLDLEGIEETALILVATSGDTGKAALDGFCDVPKTAVCVYYPKDGVAKLQELQMTTQVGDNVHVLAVEGNFDDAQTGVKRIFGDDEIREKLLKKQYTLSSANSINFGRLAPQIVYYFTAYADLLRRGEIKNGEAVDYVVPTGNFGNILAGWYAKAMGLPIGKLICASNKNNVLYDFYDTGCYDVNRDFHQTLSPSMDILVSSNLERLLYEISGRDSQMVKDLMEGLKKDGRYAIRPELHSIIHEGFTFGWADDTMTRETILKVWEKHHYLSDTHTAVALSVNEKIDGDRKRIVLSTASPYKFASDVLSALGEDSGKDSFQDVQRLSGLTGTKVPETISRLKDSQVLHTKDCEVKGMDDALLDLL